MVLKKIRFLFLIFGFVALFFTLEAMQRGASYVAAGVTPFAYNAGDNKVYLLVGWDNAKQAWNSFGGQRSGDNNPKVTAAREGAEETMCILDDNPNLFFTNIQGSKTYNTFFNEMKEEYKTRAGKAPNFSYGWFVEINYDPTLPSKFQHRRSMPGLPNDWREFSKIQWVLLDDIINKINSKQTIDFSGETVYGGFAVGSLIKNRKILSNIQQTFSTKPPISSISQPTQPTATPVTAVSMSAVSKEPLSKYYIPLFKFRKTDQQVTLNNALQAAGALLTQPMRLEIWAVDLFDQNEQPILNAIKTKFSTTPPTEINPWHYALDLSLNEKNALIDFRSSIINNWRVKNTLPELDNRLTEQPAFYPHITLGRITNIVDPDQIYDTFNDVTTTFLEMQEIDKKEFMFQSGDFVIRDDKDGNPILTINILQTNIATIASSVIQQINFVLQQQQLVITPKPQPALDLQTALQTLQQKLGALKMALGS